MQTRQDPVTAARVAELVARHALAADLAGWAPRRSPEATVPETLTVFVLMPRTDVGGGARVLIEHANRLTDRGHRVVLMAHFPRPTWCEVRAEFRQVPFGVDLASAVEPCDVVLAGYIDQVLAVAVTGAAPVVHFEQGDKHLFEELPDADLAFASANLRAADTNVTVSGTVARVIEDRYGVPATVVPNAVDPATFSPGPRREGPPVLLAVGWDGSAFKGIDDVERVWHRLRDDHPDLELVWVTPHLPKRLRGRVVVSPSQPELAELYRQASVYLCASSYESFPLPPVEAMACGTPVVATRNVGVLEYAVDGTNALLADIGDVEGLAAAVDRVLRDEGLADRLRAGGAATAASFRWDEIVDRMEALLRTAAAGPRVQPDRRGWKLSLGGLRFRDDQAPAALDRLLAATPYREVAVPVSVPAFDGHRVVRWRTVARRHTGVPGTARLPLVAEATVPATAPPLSKAQRAFAAGRPAEALAGLVPHLVDDPGASRWAALCLLELGRDDEAVELLDLALDQWPDYTDLHYLAALAAALTGRPVDRAALHRTVTMLGPATRYAEWLDEPLALVQQRLPLEDSP